MPRLCTYIVKKDSGFAPNPFGGRCTLAHCTPNHMNVQLDKGDWIAGFLSKSKQNRFLFAMEVEVVIPLNCYFVDERFESKKPKSSVIYEERCGDNIYEYHNGKWIQHKNESHGPADKDKDTRHGYRRAFLPNVFAASKFWYLGTR